jgi:hypothetical protein
MLLDKEVGYIEVPVLRIRKRANGEFIRSFMHYIFKMVFFDKKHKERKYTNNNPGING